MGLVASSSAGSSAGFNGGDCIFGQDCLEAGKEVVDFGHPLELKLFHFFQHELKLLTRENTHEARSVRFGKNRNNLVLEGLVVDDSPFFF